VQSTAKDLLLEFWLAGELYHLWYEDSSLRPLLTFWPQALPLKIKKKPSPLQLFLKAHFLGKRLEHVSFHVEYGRLLRLYFEKEHWIEFRLFPHGQNVSAHTPDKSVSLHKPKELQKREAVEDTETILRSVEEFSHQWLSEHQARAGSGKLLGKSPGKSSGKQQESSMDKDLEKARQKLKKALQKIGEELEKKDFELWRRAGEWLAAHQSLESLPEEFVPLVDRRRSWAWNRDLIFTRAKELKRKRAGTEERLRILKKQLQALEENGNVIASGTPSSSAKDPSETFLPRRTSGKDLKTRTLSIGTDVRVMMGKSAKDNLQLLRRAKAWDLWFHLKNVPSSHAVAFRPKGRALSPKEENEIIQWFFRQNFGKRFKEEVGLQHEVIVAECRFVKPIKGDRIGRVHYHNEKVLRLRVKES